MKNYTIQDSSTSTYHFYPEDYTNFTTQSTEKNCKQPDWLDEIKKKNELAVKLAIETQRNCNHNHQMLTNHIFRLVGQIDTLNNEIKCLRGEVDSLKKK